MVVAVLVKLAAAAIVFVYALQFVALPTHVVHTQGIVLITGAVCQR